MVGFINRAESLAVAYFMNLLSKISNRDAANLLGGQ
jgi:hypothetical protein